MTSLYEISREKLGGGVNTEVLYRVRGNNLLIVRPSVDTLVSHCCCLSTNHFVMNVSSRSIGRSVFIVFFYLTLGNSTNCCVTVTLRIFHCGNYYWRATVNVFLRMTNFFL